MVKNKWYGVKVLGAINSDIEKKLELVGQYVEGQAIKAISSGPTMAVDTGRLKNSITHDPPAKDRNGHYVRIGTNVTYAPYVELGTVKMGPRPFLRLALINSQTNIQKIFEA